MPLVAPQRRILLACFAAFVFAFPIAYENALWGFQCQVYLALFFGIAALVAFAPARPFSLRWFGGLAAAVLSCLSFGTGVATLLAAGGLAIVQLATNARNRRIREWAAVAVLAAAAAGMVLWESSGAHPMSTPWTFLQGLLLFTGAVILAVIPLAWFCWHTVARRAAVSERAWIPVGVGGWVAIQVVMLAYGRGTLVAPRYMDILLLAYPPALVAVFAFADRARGMRSSRYAGPGAVWWVFTVVAAAALLNYGSVLGSLNWSQSAAQQGADVRSYLVTGNVDDLRAKDGRGQTINLSYPLPELLAGILRDPEVRAILPPDLRPPDADNAGARNRMWLKGAPAGVTATAVRVVLWTSPALLALGVSLFFAVGARRPPIDEHWNCGG
jgi:hypothetical protein